MKKIEAKDLMMTDSRIQAYKSKFDEQGLPFEEVIDDIIDKNGWGTYGDLIKAALEILEGELKKQLAKEGKTGFGKFWRKWLRKLGILK